MNSLGDPARLGLVCSPRTKVVPHRSETGRPAPALKGLEAIGAWLASSPPGTRFRTHPHSLRLVAGPGLRGELRFSRVSKGHRHGGLWTLRLGADGRLAELHHRPDPLAPEHRAPSQTPSAAPPRRRRLGSPR